MEHNGTCKLHNQDAMGKVGYAVCPQFLPLGGRDRLMASWRPAWAQYQEPVSKKTQLNKTKTDNRKAKQNKLIPCMTAVEGSLLALLSKLGTLVDLPRHFFVLDPFLPAELDTLLQMSSGCQVSSFLTKLSGVT